MRSSVVVMGLIARRSTISLAIFGASVSSPSSRSAAASSD
jgi:hypothetical protein